MLRRDPVVAWVVDDTGFPKKGRDSVGVARQYCGQVGKQDNCRVAVSLSVTTEKASMPVAFRLYLPESWIEDRKRRKKTGVPDSIQFQTKPEIALEQIRRARERGIPQGVVLADAGYGTDTGFRAELTKLEMAYVVGIQSTTTVWKPGEEPKPAPARKGNTGRPRKLLQRDAKHQPVSVKELALSLPAEAWKKVTWRQGVKQKLQSRFAAMRVRPAHRDYWRAEPHPEEWLLIEWPAGESEPTKYWLSTLPADTALVELVHLAKHRWIIERDYQELKQELGLGPLRRTRLARLSSSRHLMHRGLWIPGGRTESFFPLSPSRQSWTTNARAAARLPAAWFAAFVPSGIIRAPSLP